MEPKVFQMKFLLNFWRIVAEVDTGIPGRRSWLPRILNVTARVEHCLANHFLRCGDSYPARFYFKSWFSSHCLFYSRMTGAFLQIHCIIKAPDWVINIVAVFRTLQTVIKHQNGSNLKQRDFFYFHWINSVSESQISQNCFGFLDGVSKK